MRRGAIALFVSISAVASSHAESAKIEGWGAYKFGMTAKQVRAVPHFKWKSRGTRLDSVGLVLLGEVSYSMSIDFHDNRIRIIDLSGSISESSSIDCRGSFERALAAIEPQYGPLVALVPRRTDTTWRGLGRSTYSERASLRAQCSVDGTCKRLRAHSFGAWRLSGDRAVRVFATRTQEMRTINGHDFGKMDCSLGIIVQTDTASAQWENYNLDFEGSASERP